MTNEQIYIMCTFVYSAKLRTYSLRDKYDENSTAKGETSVCMVGPRELQMTKGEVPTMDKLTVEQKEDAYCCEATTQILMDRSEFYVDHNGFRVCPLKIQGCLQKDMPASLRQRILYLEHYLPIAGHLREGHMHEKIRRNLFGLLQQTNFIRR